MPFNIQGPELILILIIALIVIGPGKLPDVGSALGKSIREFRRAATDVKESTRLDAAPAAAATSGATATATAPAPAPASTAAAAPAATAATGPAGTIPEPVSAPAEPAADAAAPASEDVDRGA